MPVCVIEYPARNEQMSDLQDLDREIQQRIESAEEKCRLMQNEMQTKMVEMEKRYALYEQFADEMMTDIVDPRMEKLVSYFDNAKLQERNDAGRRYCIARFDHSARFPASVKLTLSIAHDTEIENLLLVYDLGILPIFFKYEAHSQASFPLNELNREQVLQWVDGKILLFVDTYLRLEQTEQYQQNNLVTDPVCGMRFRKGIASAEVKYDKHSFYFCSPGCHEAFVDEPGKYISGPQKAS